MAQAFLAFVKIRGFRGFYIFRGLSWSFVVVNAPWPPLILEGELVTSAYMEGRGVPFGSRHLWLGDAIYGRLYHVAPAFL